MIALVRAVMLVLALGASCAHAADIEYLAPPGAPAREFPAPKRPVAQIVSPSRSGEEHRDSLDENGEIVRFLGLKPGMTVGDIGVGSGYHTVRLSPLLVHVLRQHRGHDRSDRRFLLETGNDRRNDGHFAHRLQRRPQLAQLFGG